MIHNDMPVINAARLSLTHAPLPLDDIVAGDPTSATVVFNESDGHEVGVWEMTEGTATDIEADEVFVVIAGSATIEGVTSQPLTVGPGDVVRLTDGMRTTWTVHETLRKVYFAY